MTEGGVDEAGVFHKIPWIDDARLEEIFAREVLRLLVSRELLSPEWAERILSWPHSGFNVHSYYGLYANAHRGKVRKANVASAPLRIVEEDLRRLPAKGWAAMIRKVYEVDPMTCPKCGGRMKVVTFITDAAVVDRIIDHLKLTFVAERPPPPLAALPVHLWEADPPAGYFPDPPAVCVP